MKVLFVGLAILTAWLISTTIKNRNKITYLRNRIVQLEKIIIKIETHGKKTKTKEGEEA